MTETTNFNLKKPDLDDFYNVGDFNDNADILDAELKKSNDNIAQLADDALNIKKLGWTVPGSMTVRNYVGTDGKFHKKVGRVDLGSLNYVQNPTLMADGIYALVDFPQAKNDGTEATYYSKDFKVVVGSNWEIEDKEIKQIKGFGRRIRVASATTYSEFKQAVSGKYLYFELATEEILDIDGYEAGYFARKSVTTNLLKTTLQSAIERNCNITKNTDESYTYNVPTTTHILEGGSMSQSYLVLDGKVKKGTYKFLGCPRGGSNQTYRLNILPSVGASSSDIGDGVIVTFTEDVTVKVYAVIIVGTVVNNLIFKPMLTTDLDATYDDFVPYTGDTGSLNSDVAGIREATPQGVIFSCVFNDTIPTIVKTGKFCFINGFMNNTSGSITIQQSGVVMSGLPIPKKNISIQAKLTSNSEEIILILKTDGTVVFNHPQVTFSNYQGIYIPCAIYETI